MSAINLFGVHGRGDGGEDFVGEVGIVYCAGDDDGADEAGVGGESFLSAKTIGTAVDHAGEIVEERAKFVGEGRYACPSLTGSV